MKYNMYYMMAALMHSLPNVLQLSTGHQSDPPGQVQAAA